MDSIGIRTLVIVQKVCISAKPEDVGGGFGGILTFSSKC